MLAVICNHAVAGAWLFILTFLMSKFSLLLASLCWSLNSASSGVPSIPYVPAVACIPADDAMSLLLILSMLLLLLVSMLLKGSLLFADILLFLNKAGIPAHLTLLP